VNTPTWILLGAYVIGLVAVARRRGAKDHREGFLLAGRALTLPAFVATLVTTWYGGILGIGEFAYRFGVSTWIVFGLPYYLAAVLFGVLLAPRLRRSGAASIPDLLEKAYGRAAARTGATGIWLATIPVAYLLMLAALLRQVTGMSMLSATLTGAAFSAIYVGMSGFRAVVRTDALQMVLMFGGFALLLPAALNHIGGFAALWPRLPEAHQSFSGGLGWQTIVVWYLIALQTMVEPAFYQRVFAARSPGVARTGIFISVALWSVFDFLSIFSGLAARVVVPSLDDPLAAYPALAEVVLATWPAAVFTVALFAIVMSTLDSYLFLAASTFGRDFSQSDTAAGERRRIRVGIFVSSGLAVAGALLFDSAVEVWHHVGTVLTSSLMIPVLATNLPAGWRPGPRGAVFAMVGAAVVAVAWIANARGGVYPFGIEPMFPALTFAGLCWGAGVLIFPTQRSGGA
jgi:SSS family solute:Na+ symporter